MREGAQLSQSMLALGDLCRDLSQNRTPNRVVTSYAGSNLTRLLRDELGGNCVTRVICCLRASSNKNGSDESILSAVLRFTTQLSQVVNFPVVNDPFARVS